jgi:hypothetical protein
MTLPPSPIATAADYADAMLIARQAKNWMALLLVVMLAIQIALFFMVRFDVLRLPGRGGMVPATTQPETAAEVVDARQPVMGERVQGLLQWLIGLIDFLGVICALVLLGAMLLILVIMLIGRLIGVSHVTAALIGCLFLLALLFPWQAFLDNAGLTYAKADFKIPGVLYTWGELAQRAHFATSPLDGGVMLSWARFVGFPVVAFILLLWIHGRSTRGMRLALGETEAPLSEPPANP